MIAIFQYFKSSHRKEGIDYSPQFLKVGQEAIMDRRFTHRETICLGWSEDSHPRHGLD